MSNIKNGIYITNEDFDDWQNYMTKLLNSHDNCSPKGCADCKKCISESEHNMRTKNITFVVTEACNLNCTYCYECHKTNRRMTKEVAKQAIDMIFNEELLNGYYDFETSKSVIIDFIGGEPLLEIELMDYIVEYFKFRAFELDHPWATNYAINVTSNGVLYNDEKVLKFFDKNKGKANIGITIDGNKELHDKCRVFHDGRGSYDIVEESVKKWIRTQQNSTTKITLCPENVSYLNEAIKNVISLGIKGAYTNCVFEPGWTLEHAVILYNEMIKLADYILEDENYTKFYCSLFDETIGEELRETKNWCGGNGDMLAIAPDGKCYPCIRFMNYSISNPDVKEQPIGDVWKGLDAKEDNEFLKELCKIDMITQCQHEDNKKCLTCPIASGCSLCTGFNYDYYGDPNHKATFICDMHKARVLANVYFWNKLYKQLDINKTFKSNISKEWALEIISEEEYNKLIKLTIL